MSEWAAEHRRLSPEASAEPGQWRNERAPHLVAIMDALSPHDPCQEVVGKLSSQTGKTECLLNFAGYIASQDPGPCMIIQPNTAPMGEAFSKDRIAPLFRDTPVLSGMLQKKGRNSANTLLHKSFPGGHITIGGANSPAGLASRPIRYLMFDEIDRYEITKEGHAIPLATKRTRTFHNRKILKVSSPTLDGVGIDAEYESCDIKHEFQLVCPDCGDSQMPFLRHFQWEGRDISNAVYVCEHCGTAHSIKKQDRIKASGVWVVTEDNGQDRKKGFWMNQFASPFASWVETLAEFLEAKDDPQRLQVVVNTAFAETWKEQGERVEADMIAERRYKYDVPDDVLLVVAGVDVQDDRLEIEYVGYGEHWESWGLGYHILYGDPDKPELWAQLDQYLQRTFETEDGRRLAVAATGIDSGGHFTQMVYDFCKMRKARRVWALKGMGGEGRAIVTAPSRKKGPNTRPVDLYTVGTDAAKSLIYSRLKITEPGPGYCHYNHGYDEEYFHQLTAEEIRTKYRKGFAYREWVKTRPRNEALDVRVYALTAATILNPVWDVLKRSKPKPHTEEEVENQPNKVANGRLGRQNRQRTGGYVNSWR